MIPQIKQRIDQIRRGEVPEGYKREKVGVVPCEWAYEKLDQYLIQHHEVSEYTNQYPVLTSSRKGIFLQSDYYTREVASEDNTGYNVVPRGYFTYRHMSDDEIFKFNINTLVDKGIVSTLYPVFTTKNICDYFLQMVLNEGREFRRFAILQKQGGSRTYMYFDKLKQLKICVPPISEQEKIAEILSAQDKLIALKEKLIEEKKRQKKALMQQLLTGKQRFHGFFDEWCHKRISDICDVLDTLRKPLNASERAGRKKEYPYYGANGIVDYIDEYLLDDSVILLAEDGGNFENFNNKPIAYWVEGKCWVNNHAHILKPQKKYCEKFVFYALEHKDIRVYINGTTRSKLTQEDLLAIDNFLPTQIEEQQMIAKILGDLDREV